MIYKFTDVNAPINDNTYYHVMRKENDEYIHRGIILGCAIAGDREKEKYADAYITSMQPVNSVEELFTLL